MGWWNYVYDEELPVCKKQCKECGTIGWLMYRASFSDGFKMSPMCWDCLIKRAEAMEQYEKLVNDHICNNVVDQSISSNCDDEVLTQITLFDI